MHRDVCGRRGAPVPFDTGRSAGFTLTELVITLGTLALVSALGVSSFNRYIGETRADTLILNLRTALMLARSEAIKRGASVMLCRRQAGSDACDGSGATGQLSWGNGWLLFVDRDQDRDYDTAAGDRLLRRYPAIDARFYLEWNRGSYLGYRGSGALDSRNGSFCLWNLHGAGAIERELWIPYSGRVRGSAGACSH